MHETASFARSDTIHKVTSEGQNNCGFWTRKLVCEVASWKPLCQASAVALAHILMRSEPGHITGDFWLPCEWPNWSFERCDLGSLTATFLFLWPFKHVDWTEEWWNCRIQLQWMHLRQILYTTQLHWQFLLCWKEIPTVSYWSRNSRSFNQQKKKKYCSCLRRVSIFFWNSTVQWLKRIDQDAILQQYPAKSPQKVRSEKELLRHERKIHLQSSTCRIHLNFSNKPGEKTLHTSSSEIERFGAVRSASLFQVSALKFAQRKTRAHVWNASLSSLDEHEQQGVRKKSPYLSVHVLFSRKRKLSEQSIFFWRCRQPYLEDSLHPLCSTVQKTPAQP